MRRRLALLLAAVVLVAWPVAQAPAQRAPAHVVVAAHTCSAGYTSAMIGRAGHKKHKCLRAGQFCAHRYDRQYRHYSYRCIKYYSNVDRYRLTHA